LAAGSCRIGVKHAFFLGKRFAAAFAARLIAVAIGAATCEVSNREGAGMGNRLQGKAAIITGGAGGIGSATARLFAEQGASVCIVDDDAAELERTTARLRGEVVGAALLGIAADVAQEPEAARAVAAAATQFGRLDILVNCAGIRAYRTIGDSDADSWRRILEVNLLSYSHVTRAALPQLRAAGKSSIVNISSTYAVTGRAGMGQYDATKAAILALTRTLAFEEATNGVRVNAVCPGFALTPFHRRRAAAAGQSIPEFFRESMDACLLKRWAEPIEIAYPVLWLASDEASYVTAATFMVDGGRPVN
jgi:2-hydroxycyclohexanecarboxyl-CoA dehydrogenase